MSGNYYGNNYGNVKIYTKIELIFYVFGTQKMHQFIELEMFVELRTFVTILLECLVKNVHFVQWEKS